MAEYVLGINCHAHDSSAALLRDGELVFAATEERFSRVKKDRGFPVLAIQAAIDHAGIDMSDLMAVAFGWNRPGLGPLHTIRQAARGRLPLTSGWTGQQVYHLASELRHAGGLKPLQKRFGAIDSQRVFYVDHHESHAWSTYAVSGFDEALVLVMDGWGAWQSTTIYHGRNGQLTPLRVFAYPNSIGIFYEAFTDLLGFERQNDEWKVMGLAAYGQPTYDLSDYLRVTEGGYVVNSRALSGRYYGDIAALVDQRSGPGTMIRSPDFH